MPAYKHHAIIVVVDSEKMKDEDVEAYIFQACKRLIEAGYGYAVSDVYLEEYYSEGLHDEAKTPTGE